jgi:hypothetical protein
MSASLGAAHSPAAAPDPAPPRAPAPWRHLEQHSLRLGHLQSACVPAPAPTAALPAHCAWARRRLPAPPAPAARACCCSRPEPRRAASPGAALRRRPIPVLTLRRSGSCVAPREPAPAEPRRLTCPSRPPAALPALEKTAGREGGKRSAACGRKGRRHQGRDKAEREERGMDFPKDLCVISENCKGLSVKQNFPLI